MGLSADIEAILQHGKKSGTSTLPYFKVTRKRFLRSPVTVEIQGWYLTGPKDSVRLILLTTGELGRLAPGATPNCIILRNEDSDFAFNGQLTMTYIKSVAALREKLKI